MEGNATTTRGRAARRARTRRQRTSSIVAAALACFAITVAASSAAPLYTDWSAPVSLGPIVNSTSNDSTPAPFPDGLSLYFDSNRPGGLGGRDIWVSQRPALDAPWGVPVNLGATVNTTGADYGPSFSPDGHWLYFNSDRPGGFGRLDVYRSYRADVHDDFGWETPTNLGPNVNGAADDGGAKYLETGGGAQLLFNSVRDGRRPDLFLSSLQADGTWGPAARIDELNSDQAENTPTIRRDGLEILFYSDRLVAGENDLWVATRPSVDALWSAPVKLAEPLNSAANDRHPYFSEDGRTLFFSSSRPGGLGGDDLYMTTREQVLPATKDDCKQGGWQRFGVFANQGDCVSWVATRGKNPPG